jgi:uncharacterized membrane protein
MIPWWWQALIILVDILAFSLVAVVAYRSGRLAERLEREADAEKADQNAKSSSV